MTKELQVESEGFLSSVDNVDDCDQELRKCTEPEKRAYGSKNPFCCSIEKMFISTFCTDMILKIFIFIFYAIFPCDFKKHSKKLTYKGLSIILTLLQWSSLINEIYFMIAYQTSVQKIMGLLFQWRP